MTWSGGAAERVRIDSSSGIGSPSRTLQYCALPRRPAIARNGALPRARAGHDLEVARGDRCAALVEDAEARDRPAGAPVADEQQRPPVADHLQSAGNRAIFVREPMAHQNMVA